VLRTKFAPNSDEVTGQWKKLHNKEIHNLHSSSNSITLIRSEYEIDRACSTHGVMRNG